MASYKQVIEGLKILSKYDPKGEEGHGVAAEHDVLYGGQVDAEKVIPEDRAALEKLGWHIDTEVNSWARFV